LTKRKNRKRELDDGKQKSLKEFATTEKIEVKLIPRKRKSTMQASELHKKGEMSFVLGVLIAFLRVVMGVV